MTWIDTHVHIWTQDTDKYPATGLSDFEPKEFMPEILFWFTRGQIDIKK